jgi:hypothetical protein
MKKNIVLFVALMVIFYFSVSFYNWDINPAHWGYTIRFGYIFICPIFSTIILLLNPETKKNEKDFYIIDYSSIINTK